MEIFSVKFWSQPVEQCLKVERKKKLFLFKVGRVMVLKPSQQYLSHIKPQYTTLNTCSTQALPLAAWLLLNTVSVRVFSLDCRFWNQNHTCLETRKSICNDHFLLCGDLKLNNSIRKCVNSKDHSGDIWCKNFYLGVGNKTFKTPKLSNFVA